MVKYYILFAFSLMLLIGLSVYFLSEKYSLGDNFPATSIYRSDQVGESIIFETLRNDSSKNVMTHEDPLKGFLKYSDVFFIFNSLIINKESKAEELAQQILDGNHLMVSSVQFFDGEESEEAKKKPPKSKLEKESRDLEKSDFASGNNKKKTSSEKLYELIQEAGWHEKTTLKAEANVLQLKEKSKKVFSKFSDVYQVEAQDLDGHPIMISAPFGKGKVFLLSDDYFLSNDYFLKNKDDEFLDKFFVKSSKTNIVFDQTAIGVRVSPGIMGLIRRYHFEGVILAFMLMGLLMVWRLGVEHHFDSDYTPIEKMDQSDIVLVEDPLMVLLNNNINTADLIKHAFSELESSALHKYHLSSEKLMEVKKISKQRVFKNAEEVVEVYNQIVKSIKLGKTK